MYESDGSIMVYWHALDTPETPTGVYILTVDQLNILSALFKNTIKHHVKGNYYMYYMIQ